MSAVKRQNTFTFEFESAAESKTYEGKFTARIATFMDRQRINTRASQICGGMYCVRDDDGLPTGRGIDEDTEVNAKMIAWLETVLIQKPEWFSLDNPDTGVTDEKLIIKLFGEVMKFEKRFRGDVGASAQGEDGSAAGGEGTGASEHPAAQSGNRPKRVVGGEVPASLDP